MSKAGDVPLKTPFPYPGGKSRVADLVWSRLGNTDNYVEPFAGSLAVLLRRPADHFTNGYRVETANDLNHYIVNFWRAVKADPEAVAEHCDHPVLEADLHARHKWLVRSAEAVTWRKRMVEDADAYDAKIAGWWCWGQCCWIGSGWCAEKGITRGEAQRIALRFDGINATPTDWEQIPDLDPGRGITAPGVGSTTRGRPQLTDAFDIGRGVNAGGHLSQQCPELAPDTHRGILALAGGGTCDARRAWLIDWMRRLADRLRLVRTCYGHWSRICDSDSTMTRLGTTGVLLDPPYPANRGDTGKKSRDATLYATDKGADLDQLRDEVLAWCRKWGQDKQVRIAVCGYEGDGYESLTTGNGWVQESWEASGGYANQRRAGKGKSENAKRERIWFSPHCLTERKAPSLFDSLEADAA